MSINEIRNIIVVGAGIAGVTAAIAAAKTGASVLLVGNEGTVGGDACTGMPILGTYSSKGKKCVGGILDDLLEICKKMPGGYIGPVCDFRTVYGLCVNPEAMRVAILLSLKRYNVRLLLNSTVTGVESGAGTVNSVKVVCVNGQERVFGCQYIVDATGCGNIVKMAGGKVLYGDKNGNMQPVSLIFRMAKVSFRNFLQYIMKNPEEALLAENPVFEKDRVKAAELLCKNGYPYVALSAGGKLLGSAIGCGEMYPCTAMFLTPSLIETGEICVNSTRIANINATDTDAASRGMLDLAEQLHTAIRFLVKRVPGFGNAVLSSVASRLGVRETGRIAGEYELKQDDVVHGMKFADSIGQGTHHVDIHGAGTAQIRIPVRDGDAYGIPFGCLLPRSLQNVIAAGRCISSDRGANGSVRVMGSCIVTGQAAGVAASYAVEHQIFNARDVDVRRLQRDLAGMGAILDWRA